MTRRIIPVLLGAVVAYLPLCPLVAAAEEELDFMGGFEIEEEEPAVVYHNEATLRAVYTSTDNFMFGRYNGLDEKGFRLDGDISLVNDTDARQMTLNIRRLGLDNRDLRFNWRALSGLKIDLGYEETPSLGNDTGLSPFVNAGGDSLVLPSAWVSGVVTGDFTATDTFHRVRPETKRKRFNIDVSKRYNSKLKVGANVSFEAREGTRLQGMAIYSNAANPQAVILPVPVDDDVASYDLSLDYHDDRLVLRGSYRLERFENDVDRVTWQNPYTSGLGVADYPDGVGGFTPAPDYDHQQVSIAAAYRFNRNIRFVVDAASSATEQDEGLQPYTVNPLLSTTVDLPTTSLDDSLDVQVLNAAVLTNWQRLRVNLRYRYQGRDNTASRYAWQYVRGDGYDQMGSEHAISNRPLETESDLYTVQASYRFANHTRVAVDYEFEEKYRNFASVEDTEEDRLTLRVDLPELWQVSNRFEVLVSDLAGSTYEWSRSYFQTLSTDLIARVRDDQRWANHPLLRQYHLANQERQKLSWRASWQPDDQWLLQLHASGDDVEFDKSELGLTDVSDIRVNLSVSFTGSEDYASWLWINYHSGERDQMGRDFNAGLQKPANQVNPPLAEGSDPSRNFGIEQEIESLSVGVGTNWQISSKLKLEVSYSYLDAEENYNLSAFGARDLAGDDLPGTDYRMHTLSTRLDYAMNDRMTLALEHEYFRYSDNSWQYENIGFNSLDKVLTTGLLNPDEVVNVVMLAMSYRF